MDPLRLPELLGLSERDVERLSQAGLVRVPPPAPKSRQLIDYVELQKTYRRMLDNDGLVSQADLARHLGVSRVWVSRVLKGIKRKAG